MAPWGPETDTVLASHGRVFPEPLGSAREANEDGQLLGSAPCGLHLSLTISSQEDLTH